MRGLLLLVALTGCQFAFPRRDDDGDDDMPPVVDNWVAVTAGSGHTCALDVDGRLYCWGRNLDGELGLMGAGEVPELHQVGAARWTSVSTTNRHTCGIQEDGTAWCWGANEKGQLGNNSVQSSSEPIMVEIGAVHAIAAADAHTCAIREDRSIMCWGRNAQSELGDGGVTDSLVPVAVASSLRFSSIATSTSGPNRAGTSCAIAEDATLWCWGLNLEVFSTLTAPTQVGTQTWRKISLGATHACGITTDGTMRCWGGFSNGAGQLGNNSVVPSATPVGAIVDGEDRTDWTDVAINANHSCGIAGGHWYCWGSSATGQLGLDGKAVNPLPVELGAGTTWTSLASGGGHNCAIASDRTMWCVGARGFGQLGNGSSSVRVPKKLDGSFKQVDLGRTTMCAISTDGNALCTGDNSLGALGTGTFDSQQALRAIEGTGWSEISAGMFHSCGILNAEVRCWGPDYVGQISGAVGGTKLSPTATTPAIVAAHVSANGEHTCAWTSVQTSTKCWGSNQFAQMGKNFTSVTEAPGDVVSSTFSAIGAGEVHTCGIDGSGRVLCWGLGTDGRVGQNVNVSVQTPQPIMNNGTFFQLSTGDGSSCAIDAGNNMFCWGTNYGGELGLGNRASRPTPEQVAGMWTAVSVGAEHACGLKGPDLYCWGSNDRGQLGINSLVETLTPTFVPSSGGWRSISAGDRSTCAIDMSNELWCWGDNSVGQLGTGDAWSLEPVQVTAPDRS